MTTPHDNLVRMAAAAGLGQFRPAENGIPASWMGVDLAVVERFAAMVAAECTREPKPIILEGELSAEDLEQFRKTFKRGWAGGEVVVVTDPVTPPSCCAGGPQWGVWLFNPYTGYARHNNDITSDPHGVLVIPPKEH